MATVLITTKLASLAFIFLVVVLMMSHNISPTVADKDFIVQTCNNTPFSKTCESALLADPRGLKATDVTSLALVLIDAVQSKGLEILEEIQKLRVTNPELENPLLDCFDSYDFLAHDDHDKAVQAVSKGNPKFGENAILDSQSLIQNCENSFKISGKKFPFTNLNSDAVEITDVTRAVIQMLL